MRQRGRKSAAALALAPQVDAARTRVRPRADAPESLRAVIRDLVASCDASHFRASDWPLLESYGHAILLERAAYEALESSGALTKDGKPNSWLMVAEKAGRQIVACSARLRLSPQSRTDSKAAGIMSRKPRASIYDQVGRAGA